MPKVLSVASSGEIDQNIQKKICSLSDFFKILKTKDAVNCLEKEVFYLEEYLNAYDTEDKLPLEYATYNDPLKKYLIAQGASMLLVLEKDFNTIYQQSLERINQLLPSGAFKIKSMQDFALIKKATFSNQFSTQDRLSGLLRPIRNCQTQQYHAIPAAVAHIMADVGKIGTLVGAGFTFCAVAMCLRTSQLQPSAFINNVINFLGEKCVSPFVALTLSVVGGKYVLYPNSNPGILQWHYQRALKETAEAGYKYVMQMEAEGQSTPTPKALLYK